MSLTPTFWTVFQFDSHIEDFRVHGVYTLQADAEAHAARIKRENLDAPIILLDQDGITQRMIKNRLGKLYDVLLKIEGKMT